MILFRRDIFKAFQGFVPIRLQDKWQFAGSFFRGGKFLFNGTWNAFGKCEGNSFTTSNKFAVLLTFEVAFVDLCFVCMMLWDSFGMWERVKY